MITQVFWAKIGENFLSGCMEKTGNLYQKYKAREPAERTWQGNGGDSGLEGVKNNLSQMPYKVGLREGKFYKNFSKMWKNPIDKIFQHLSVNSNTSLNDLNCCTN